MTRGKRYEPTLPEILGAQELLSADTLAYLHDKNPEEVNPDVIAVLSGIYEDVLSQGTEVFPSPLEISIQNRKKSFKFAIGANLTAIASSANAAYRSYEAGYEEAAVICVGLGLLCGGLIAYTLKINADVEKKI